MRIHRRQASRLALIAAVAFLTTASDGFARPAVYDRPDAVEVAQAPEPPTGELQPRYQPAPLPPQKSWYNSSYIFAATRGVADSTMVPPAKAVLFVLTVPLDLILLPFATIGGMFG